jgi:prepilin-type N-terminal cleavage/methylation domain-containing protein
MKTNRVHGMTLLELLIAMALLSLIMSAALPLANQMMSRFQMARDHYVAATLCQARIERARAVPYSDLRLLAETGSLVDDFGNLSDPNGRFKRTTTVVTNTPAGMTTMSMRTQICICSRWGWRKCMHPIKEGSQTCRFTDECEEMTFLFTEYNKK